MLDLTGYRLTFDDEFNGLSVSPTGSGTVWADTRSGSLLRPGVDIGFGQSAFVDASSGIEPFSVANGALRIEAAPATGAAADLVSPGLWSSGLIHTSGTFSQAYGYFEMRADLPEGAGSWPGFWLLAADGRWPPELDIVETYGADPATLTNSVHTAATGPHTFQTVWTHQPTLPAGFHTFGALWTPDTVTFYFDGAAVGHLATPADMHGSMYPVVALAMSRDVPGTTDDPRAMLVDYVRAYSADPAATAVALQPVASPDGATGANLYGAVAASGGGMASGGGTVPPQGGPDILTLHVSGDLWNGGPVFTVAVDGVRVGGPYEVTADHASGTRQDITLAGEFGAGPHAIRIDFINDAVGQPVYDPATGIWQMNDRNLFVSGVSLNGTEHGIEAMTANTASRGCDWLDTRAAVLVDNGAATFTTAGDGVPVVTGTQPAAPPVAPGAGTLTVHVSGDSWNGAPAFTVAVNGIAAGGPYEVTASHALGQWQAITLPGDFGPGPHQVAISYVNDANAAPFYDAAANRVLNDRNLFISGVERDGVVHGLDAVVSNTASIGWDRLDSQAAVMAANGTVVFGLVGLSGSGPDVPGIPL